MTRPLLVLATALVTIATVEVAALASLHIARDRAPERFVPEWDDYVAGIDQETMDHLNRNYFDAVLGWDYRPGFEATRQNSAHETWHLAIDANGSRSSALFAPEDPIQIATYGDSFTFCDEVDDDQTWQYELSGLLGVNVANFGVGGYGPDQMLLKYEAATWQAAAPAIVIFAIYEGDLNRALTRYYPFYAPESKQYLGFKPRFVLDRDSALRLIASPKTEPVRDRADLRRLIDQAREHDVWYERRIELGFPYTWQLLKLAYLLREPAFGRAWETPDETALLRAIIDRFATVARQRGHRPVLLFIPRVASWQHGRTEPPYRAFVDRLRSERPDLVTIDVAEAAFEPARFNILPFEGHASAYGNQIIARHVAAALGGLIARQTEAQATPAPAGSAPTPR